VIGAELAEPVELAWLDEVAMTVAPAALANCSANSETPPVPWTSTVAPGLTCPSVITARQAVTPAQVRVALSAWLRPVGARVKWLTGRVANSQA